jgi:DNA polymerase-1
MAREWGKPLVIDIETTIITSYKRKANVFDPQNWVVCVGWALGDAAPGMRMRPGAGWFKAVLETYSPRILIGANFKFDMLYLIRDPVDYAAWQQWVADGGMLWDIQLTEYLLEGQTQAAQMMSLDEMAPKYGGTTKFDEVKELWEAGVNTPDIPVNLLKRYLIGTDEDPGGDIGNTRLVYKGQYERAKACGQVKSILMNGGSLLCTTEMERNGLKVDVALGRELAKGLEEQLAELAIKLAEYIPKDCPFDFNWGSAPQKSALFFGGTVTYKEWRPHLDEQGAPLYATKDAVGYQTVYNDEWALEPENGWSPQELSRLRVYGSGKNKGEPKTKKVKVPDLEKPKGAKQDIPYTFPGYTKPEKRWESKSNPGQYGTGKEIIEELGYRDIPFLQDFAKRAKLSKDLTTYYVTTDPKTGLETGMLTLVQADDIIHHMLNHTSTVTARFSASSPNSQNLSKGDKSEVKTIFISRFGPDGKIVQSDFTSLEVFVQAILTKCGNLIDDLRAGLDMHCVRVAQKNGTKYEDELKRCKGYTDAEGVEHEPTPEGKKDRGKAKTFSFERAYGAGATSISTKNKIPMEDVEALIKAEEARYPEIVTFNANLIEYLEDSAASIGNFVQHPDFPGMTCDLKRASWRSPDNKLYSWGQHPAPEFLAKKGTRASFSPPEIKNYPVQGTGGEWAKAAMWLAIREFCRLKNFGGKALLINQVHDALYLDCHPDVAYEAAVVLHACMEEASAFMEYYFGWYVPVSVPSETVWGPNMGVEKPIPGNFKDDVKKHRKYIRDTYMASYRMKEEL